MPTIDSLQKRINDLEDRVRQLEKKPLIKRPKVHIPKSPKVYGRPVNGIHSQIMEIIGVNDYQFMMNSHSKQCSEARQVMLFIMRHKVGVAATVKEIGVVEMLVYKSTTAVINAIHKGVITSEFLTLIEEHGISI